MRIFISAGINTLVIFSLGFSMITLAQDLDLQDEDSRIAYSIGVNIGRNLVSQQVLGEIDFDTFVAGMRDQVNGTTQLSAEEVELSIQTFQEREVARQNEAMATARQDGEQFLTENAQNEGVVVLDSGLQYLVLESGDAGGPSPTTTEAVLAHYHGTFIDGSVFDSSVDRGEPAQFGVSQVITGWTEALQLMRVGDKWRLFIPHTLAYGEIGTPPAIPPFATLIFEVELLEIR